MIVTVIVISFLRGGFSFTGMPMRIGRCPFGVLCNNGWRFRSSEISFATVSTCITRRATVFSRTSSTAFAGRTPVERHDIILGSFAQSLGQGHFGNFPFEEFFYPIETILVVDRDKCYRFTPGIGSGGTAYTMNIVFGIMRDIIIDDQYNISNIYTSRNNIGRHENIDFPFL